MKQIQSGTSVILHSWTVDETKEMWKLYKSVVAEMEQKKLVKKKKEMWVITTQKLTEKGIGEDATQTEQI